MEKRPDRNPQRHGEHHPGCRGADHDPNALFGLDVEKISPEAQAAVGAAVIVPVAPAVVLVLAPEMWWFAFGWTIFPAFGLLLRRIAGVLDDGKGPPSGNGKGRELPGALREHGEITAARAAMETSLTVSEADEMPKGLAEGGHPEIRVKGGGLFYALWEREGAALGPGDRVWTRVTHVACVV